MRKLTDQTLVFFESESRPLTEAGALVIRRIIEEDIVNIPDFPPGGDPYKWLSERLKKSERALRGWGYDWNGPSGFKPNLIDFLTLIYMSKSRRGIEFLEELIQDATPEQREKSHGNVLKKVAQHIKELADTIDNLAEND